MESKNFFNLMRSPLQRITSIVLLIGALVFPATGWALETICLDQAISVDDMAWERDQGATFEQQWGFIKREVAPSTDLDLERMRQGLRLVYDRPDLSRIDIRRIVYLDCRKAVDPMFED